MPRHYGSGATDGQCPGPLDGHCCRDPAMGALDAPPSPDPSLCPMRTPGSSFPPAPRPTECCPWSLLLRLVLGLLLLEVPGAGLAPLHAGRGRWHLSWLQPGGDGARERGLPLSPPLKALPRVSGKGTPPSEASETQRGCGCWGLRTRGGMGVGWPHPFWAQWRSAGLQGPGHSPPQAPGPGLVTAVTSLGASAWPLFWVTPVFRAQDPSPR